MAIEGSYKGYANAYVNLTPIRVEKENVYIYANIYEDSTKENLLECLRYCFPYDLSSANNVYVQAYNALKQEDIFTSFNDV